MDETFQGLESARLNPAAELDLDRQEPEGPIKNDIDLGTIFGSKIVIVPIHGPGSLDALDNLFEDKGLERGAHMRVRQQLIPRGHTLQKIG